MSASNPFEPPRAIVIDPVDMGRLSRGMRFALMLAAIVQFAWSCFRAVPNVYILIYRNGVNPAGPFAQVLGLACLYVGVALMVSTQCRGRRWLMASIVLQLLSIVLWHNFYAVFWHPLPFLLMLLPLLLGPAIALWGWIVSSPRASPPGMRGAPE